MCDDFGSDSGGFDDIGSSDFDSDISSDFDSDVSVDFDDSDFSADIDSMDFSDVETVDFDDIDSDFDTSDFNDDFNDIETIDIDDDIETIDIDDDIETIDTDDDIETIDIDDDIETVDIEDDVETIDIDDDIETVDIEDDVETIDIDEDIETIDIDEDIETIDIDDDIEIIDIDDDIETIDIDDDIEIIDIDDDIETIDIVDDIETVDIDDDIETIDMENDIETIDIEDNIEFSEMNEDVDDVNMEDGFEESCDAEEIYEDSDNEITDMEEEFETELAEMEEMTEAMEAESLEAIDDIDSMEFDGETDSMELAEDFEDVDAIDSDDVLEDFDFYNEVEDIDVSEDIEAMDSEDDSVDTETEDSDEWVVDDSFDSIEETTSTSEDALEDTLTDFETENSETTDMPTYVDADESVNPMENVDWDSMLSDGDRDYINGIITNENYTQDQKDFFVNQALSEIYERETAEPEYGARVKGLTYDGSDIITKPPEDYDTQPYIDESLMDGLLSNENISVENLNNLRDYFDTISNDETLTDDEKSFLINQALGSTIEGSTISQDVYTTPSSIEDVNHDNADIEVAENIEGITNEYNEPFSGELSEQDFDTIYEGLNEYDFHGVDCLENVERLDSSLENFTSENWEQLSLDEQKEQMTDLAQYIIDVTGLENPPKIEFYNSGKDGDYGGFNRATNTLSINEHMLYQNDEAADTVAHELWHAYQYERASNPSTKLDHMYLENFNDYITPIDDFEGYQSQLIEAEARAFAQQIKDRLNSY